MGPTGPFNTPPLSGEQRGAPGGAGVVGAADVRPPGIRPRSLGTARGTHPSFGGSAHPAVE